jgi:hypothetical protein
VTDREARPREPGSDAMRHERPIWKAPTYNSIEIMVFLF